MNIIGTGLSGLIGTRITELLREQYVFTNLSLETGVDITQKEVVTNAIASSPAKYVWHFAAYTDVDLAEKDRLNGKSGIVWKVNVDATESIVEACRKTGKKLIYISTDYVFSGSQSVYSEADQPQPQGWYGITKYEAEKLVNTLEKQAVIIRIANPYRHAWGGKPDFIHKIIDRFNQRLPVKSPEDQIFIPTLIDDIAFALDKLVENNAHGIFHVVGSQPLSPYEACMKIAHMYGFAENQVEPVKFTDFFNGRAPRPFRANLNNDKIKNYGIQMNSFDNGLNYIRQLEGGKNL